MNLSYHLIDLDSDDDMRCAMRWQNDPESRHLWRWFPDEESLQKLETVDSVRASFSTNKIQSKTYLILLDDVAIGDISFAIDPPHLKRKVKGTAWLGIILGEPAVRGRGIGQIAMRKLEDLARADGACRAELGVFEFNVVAQALYQKLGYHTFCRVPDFTWWNGRLWADVRMEKDL